MKSKTAVAKNSHALEDQEQLDAVIKRMKRAQGQVAAVEYLGQDACGRSFASAPRAREQIRLATPIVGDGIA